MARNGIVLVLDPDEAGQQAAEKSGRKLLDLLSDWGDPRHPGEPVSQVITVLQRDIDELGDEIKGLEAAGLDSQVQSEMRWFLFDYMSTLHGQQEETLYSKCQTAEEYEQALLLPLATSYSQSGSIDFEEIKRNVNIVDYISQHTELRPRGANFAAKCPLPDHQDDTASFYVYPGTSSFYCFGCTRGGDVIEYAKLRGVPARHLM